MSEYSTSIMAIRFASPYLEVPRSLGNHIDIVGESGGDVK